MKEFKIEVAKPVKMDNGIEVTPYLTYAQIEKIVEQVERFDTWGEREYTIDFMLLSYCTNIDESAVQKIGHDTFVQSGVMKQIRNNVKNLESVYDAIGYTESTQRALAQILKEMPKILEPLEELKKKYGGSKK